MDNRETWIHPQDFQLLLKNVRWIHGWTQKELALAAGVGTSSIYEYEKGGVPPRRTAEKILAAVGHSLTDLEATLLPGLTALRLRGEPLDLAADATAADLITAIERTIRAAEVSLATGLRAERRKD
jgi:transcriptional regulator with XRE-family HTH domain